MASDRILLRTLVEIRNYIYENLCQLNELELGIFEMTERVLVRAKNPCGVLYCLYGPRRVHLTAIWETDTGTIRFYDSVGERVRTVPLKCGREVKLSIAAKASG